MTMACYRTRDNPTRLLVGRHLPACPGGQRDHCHGCQPCPEPHCRACTRTHAEDICAPCLAAVRADLHTLAALIPRLPTEATHGRGAYHSRADQVPGGDALTLAAPGTNDTDLDRALRYRLARNLDTTHALDDAVPNDPRPPHTVLDSWALHWAAALPTTPPDPDTAAIITYLNRRLHHLADHPEFCAMARDIAAAVHQLENVLHEGDRPQRSRVPCWECGTRLVKTYAATADHDHWTCPRCGEIYDHGRYERAQHQHLASAGADRYVAVRDAVTAIGRPTQTIRSWIRRGLVATSRDRSTGRLVVWWPDIRTLHRTTGTRRRASAAP